MARASFNIETPASYASRTTQTKKLETASRHALERYEHATEAVRDMEMWLGIESRWGPDDSQWQDTAKLVANREYRRAVDNLEGLVVARIFELTKMNRAGTGMQCILPRDFAYV